MGQKRKLRLSVTVTHYNTGRILAVDPLRSPQEVKRLEQFARENPMHHAIIRLGLTGLRIADIIRLKVGQVQGVPLGNKVWIVEGKTGKKNYFMVTKLVRRVLDRYLECIACAQPGDWLFPSTHKPGRHITSAAVGHMVRRYAEQAGLRERYGTHTLRKTWGYLKRVAGTDLEIIRTRYNHASLNVTKVYIAANAVEVDAALQEDV